MNATHLANSSRRAEESTMDREVRFPCGPDSRQRILLLMCSVVSLFCLSLHILLHTMIPALRKFQKDNLLHLAVILCIEQTLFLSVSAVVNADLCEIAAIGINLCYVASFTFINFVSVSVLSSLNKLEQKKYSGKFYSRRYGSYLWVLPGAMMLLGIAFQKSVYVFDKVLIVPNPVCWNPNHHSVFIYVALPVAYCLLLNVIFLLLTGRLIYCSKHGNDFVQGHLSKEQFLFNFNLSLAKGLTWILAYLSHMQESEGLWYAGVILNATQGASLFIAVSLRRSVLTHVIEWLPENGWARRQVEHLEMKACKNQIRSLTLNV